MQDHDELIAGFADAQVYTQSFLPIAAAYCRSLGLIELVNRMVPSQMEVSPGHVVQAMVLDVLSGRTPLYRVEHFLKKQDRELLLGEDIDAHLFNDTNLARSMDAIFSSGASHVVTQLGVRAAEVCSLDVRKLSYDTTSTSVWGEYRHCASDDPPKGPRITFGHSKDKRKDLKQFMTELLCVERGVPIFGQVLDGNASDKTSNNQMLSRISSLMASHGLGPGACVYVADSAMVTEANLKELGAMKFITRLPGTYSVCNELIAEAVDAEQWIELGKLSEHPDTKHRPSAEYKAYETTVELYGITYRAVVVHSSAHDKRRQKKLSRAVEDSQKTLQKALKKQQQTFFCEADALKAAEMIKGLSTKLHQVHPTVTPVEVRRRGRPPKEGPVPMETRYTLTWEIAEQHEEIQRIQELAGCFVLISSVPAAGEEGALDAGELLKAYKGQHGIENNFSFLKDDLIVNDLFLKTPSRIEVLGMILIIALMIWRLMEHQMRWYVEQNQVQLTGWDNKPTSRPTAFMMTTVFDEILTASIKGIRIILRGIGPRQQEFLQALGVTQAVYTDPGSLYALSPKAGASLA